MPKVRMAKASKEDIQATHDFLHAADNVLAQEKFSLYDPAGNWERWDEEDEDYLLIKKLQKQISEDEECEPDEVDNRVLMYTFLQEKFKEARCSYERVVIGADLVIDAACDPTLSYLAFHPGIEQMHVAPEM